MENYQKMTTYKDDRYGLISLYFDIYSPGNIILTKEHWITSNNKKTNDELIIRKILEDSQTTPYISQFLAYFIEFDYQFCSKYEKHFFAFEFPFRTLKREFELLKEKKMKELGYGSKEIVKEMVIPEDELWYLIYALALGVRGISERGYYHGDIQPRTVHVTKAGEVRKRKFFFYLILFISTTLIYFFFEKVKLLDNFLITKQQTGYQKMISDSEYKSPLSPKLFYSFKHRLPITNHEPILSDIWSIGMTVMSCASQYHFSTFYDFKNYRIRYDLIKRNFDRLRKMGYSEEFINLLSEMLEETEARRIKLKELIDFLEMVDKGLLENSQDEEDDYDLVEERRSGESKHGKKKRRRTLSLAAENGVLQDELEHFRRYLREKKEREEGEAQEFEEFDDEIMIKDEDMIRKLVSTKKEKSNEKNNFRERNTSPFVPKIRGFPNDLQMSRSKNENFLDLTPKKGGIYSKNTGKNWDRSDSVLREKNFVLNNSDYKRTPEYINRNNQHEISSIKPSSKNLKKSKKNASFLKEEEENKFNPNIKTKNNLASYFARNKPREKLAYPDDPRKRAYDDFILAEKYRKSGNNPLMTNFR